MTEATIWIIFLLIIGSTALFLVKKLFGQAGGSVKADFNLQVKRAQDLQADINKLTKESTRGTADFETALKKYRTKYGGGSAVDAGIGGERPDDTT